MEIDVMRNIAISLALVVTLVGCEVQPVTLTDADIAQIERKLGPILEADREALRVEVEKLLQAEADRVEVTDVNGDGKPEATAILVPAGDEAGGKAGETILSWVMKNPTPAGLAGGGIAALLVAIRVFSRRKRITKEHATEGQK